MTIRARLSGVAEEQVLGKAYDARLMRRVWRFVAPHWPLLLLSLLLMPVAVAFEVAQPYLLKVAIDDYIAASPPTVNGLGAIAVLYIGLVILQSLSAFAQMYAMQLLGQRSMHGLRLATYRHVLGQRAAFFDRMPVGRLLTRMTNDVETINEMFASGVVTLIGDLIKLVTIVVIMLYLNVTLTAITFVTLPLLILLVGWARTVMRTSFRAIRVKLAAMNSFVAEHLAGVKVVQAFRRERVALRDYNKINAAYRDAYLGAIRADASMYAGVEAIGVISAACIAWFAGARIGEGALTVGLVVAFIEYVNKFFIPVRDLSAKYTVMQSAMAATERIIHLLDTVEPDAPVRQATADEGAEVGMSATAHANAQGSDDRPAVEFRDVAFWYREGEEVLRGLSLEVPRGKTVAVVCATGSGKTTLIKLLIRLYDPRSGRILVNGRDITTMPADELRRRITVVSQDDFLFAGTVAENVELGLPDAAQDGLPDARERVEEALRRVGVDRVLERRGATPDERVAERGGNFSSGERQLISFARALARDPEILVLDEATAHVDPEAEAWIERGLAELTRGRTTLVIAHRLSTIRRADEIAVVARGTIVERGTHPELVAKGGVYAKFERTFSRTA